MLSSGEPLKVDAVLVAAGRNSNTEKLRLSLAGITTGARGLLSVDEHYRTTSPDIYAAGDVIGFPGLAASSGEQARIAICHAFGCLYNKHIDSTLPTGIYTIPEVSVVGATEESLRSKRIAYIVGRALYSQNTRRQTIGDSSGFLKLLFEESTLKLLGAHVIGEHASELIHVALSAILSNQGLEFFNNACFNYPTLGSFYKEATYDAILRKRASSVESGLPLTA